MLVVTVVLVVSVLEVVVLVVVIVLVVIVLVVAEAVVVVAVVTYTQDAVPSEHGTANDMLKLSLLPYPGTPSQ